MQPLGQTTKDGRDKKTRLIDKTSRIMDTWTERERKNEDTIWRTDLVAVPHVIALSNILDLL